jgi:hypothetical protein
VLQWYDKAIPVKVHVERRALPIRFLSNSTASSDFLAPRKMMNVGVYSLDHATVGCRFFDQNDESYPKEN